MKCIICGGKKIKKVSSKVRDSNNYKVIKYQNCGFLQLNPIPLKIEEKSFYDQNLQAKNIDNKIIYFIEADSEIYNHKKPDTNPYLIKI